MKFLSFLFLATVLLFSCGDSAATTEDTTEVTTEEVVLVPEAPATPSMMDKTVEAVTSVGGDITAFPAGAAVSNIEGWITELQTMDGTDEIVSNLNSLKTELMASSIDGTKVSGILATLADQTRSLSDTAPALATLADILKAGSDKLGGM